MQVTPGQTTFRFASFFTEFLAPTRKTVVELQAQKRPTLHLVLPHLAMLLSPQVRTAGYQTRYQKVLLAVLAGDPEGIEAPEQEFVLGYWDKLRLTWYAPTHIFEEYAIPLPYHGILMLTVDSYAWAGMTTPSWVSTLRPRCWIRPSAATYCTT